MLSPNNLLLTSSACGVILRIKFFSRRNTPQEELLRKEESIMNVKELRDFLGTLDEDIDVYLEDDYQPIITISLTERNYDNNSIARELHNKSDKYIILHSDHNGIKQWTTTKIYDVKEEE